MEKRALVSVGENTRIVSFSTAPASRVADSIPAVGEGDALTQAVRVSFGDILRSDQEFFLQIKNEEWGGAFVDIVGTEEVADRSVCKVVLKPATSEVSCSVKHNIMAIFYVGRFLLLLHQPIV